MIKGSPGQKVKDRGNHCDQSKTVQSIAEDLRVPDIIARILVARGIENADDARVFLKPRLEDLSDPFLIPDMEKGVERVILAVRRQETICIYGDYDADGITSLVLMVNFLKHFGITPVTYIPTRQEGYGLHTRAIGVFREKGVTLLISLDCGSSNIEEVDYATDCGIDTVIIDHHEMGQIAPRAYALINPKRKDSRFPTRDLAACGVVFFFLQALRRIMHRDGLLAGTIINLKKELDIVTIGTVGDMVPLIGDNRIMVKHGTEIMNKTPKAWLKSMYKNRVITGSMVDEFALGFIIIPRINAAGRVSKPETSLNFLIAEDELVAVSYLKDLQKANTYRQRIEEEILREIVNDLKKDHLADRSSIVVFNEKWHVGVLGIVAQKLAEMFQKPSIVITKLNNTWKGSGRGAVGVDLYETIASLSSLLLKYGGHKYACGISLVEENLTGFADAFEKNVKGSVVEKKREVFFDTEAEFEELTTEFMNYIGQLSPFGVGNPRPNLALRPTNIVSLKYGRAKITDRNNRIWHGYIQTGQSIPQSDNICLIASPVLKEEMGERFINLSIKEIAEIEI